MHKRLLAALAGAAVFTVLSWAWWPHPGSYRPIEPGERGIFTTVLQKPETEPAALARPAAQVSARPSALPAGTAAERRLSTDVPLQAVFPAGSKLPTKDNPVPAMVLVPANGESTDSVPSPSSEPIPSSESSPSTAPAEDIWVFPFDKPLPPADGDNQALAVNTTDDSVVYDVAFALVWADGNEVLNVNEAHAYASCSDCVAVALAFQVVLIMDDAQVIVPQNLAVAANYQCYRCITAAIASQLVLSVQDVPGQEDLRALDEVWNRLLQFASTITSYSLTEITAQLDAVKAEIVGILMDAPPVEGSPTGSTTATTGAGDDVGGSPSTSPTTAPALTPAPGPTAAASTPTQDVTPIPQPSTEETTTPAETTPAPSSPAQSEPSSPPVSSTVPEANTSSPADPSP
jgi:putative peptide zinc metalloprotease protein